MSTRKYEVFSSLNPDYARTGDMNDYWAIYRVGEIDPEGQMVGEPIAVFTGQNGNGPVAREAAYDELRKLMPNPYF